MTKVARFLFILIFVSLLTACGGGGGGGGGGNVNPNGLWGGTITENGITYDLSGLIFNNRLVAFSLSGNAIFAGNINMSGDQLTTTANVLQIGGGLLGTTDITATVQEQVAINGTHVTSIGTSGNINQTFYNVYNRTPDLNVVAGNYSITSGGITFAMTVAPDGSFTGADTAACIYNGTIAPADGVHNMYYLTMTISACVPATTVTGYSFMDDYLVTNDILWLVVDDPAFVYIATMQRV